MRHLACKIVIFTHETFFYRLLPNKNFDYDKYIIFKQSSISIRLKEYKAMIYDKNYKNIRIKAEEFTKKAILYANPTKQ